MPRHNDLTSPPYPWSSFNTFASGMARRRRIADDTDTGHDVIEQPCGNGLREERATTTDLVSPEWTIGDDEVIEEACDQPRKLGRAVVNRPVAVLTAPDEIFDRLGLWPEQLAVAEWGACRVVSLDESRNMAVFAIEAVPPAIGSEAMGAVRRASRMPYVCVDDEKPRPFELMARLTDAACLSSRGLPILSEILADGAIALDQRQEQVDDRVGQGSCGSEAGLFEGEERLHEMHVRVLAPRQGRAGGARRELRVAAMTRRRQALVECGERLLDPFFGPRLAETVQPCKREQGKTLVIGVTARIDRAAAWRHATQPSPMVFVPEQAGRGLETPDGKVAIVIIAREERRMREGIDLPGLDARMERFDGAGASGKVQIFKEIAGIRDAGFAPEWDKHLEGPVPQASKGGINVLR
ncbi:hypothetical protein CHELA41_24538 [Hyphomicrobiales bacterium]|nr:hypothetical protein CHELA41_24538 [Hyphomicrobiales bacterium]